MEKKENLGKSRRWMFSTGTHFRRKQGSRKLGRQRVTHPAGFRPPSILKALEPLVASVSPG